jgi:hypothetical protein
LRNRFRQENLNNFTIDVLIPKSIDLLYFCPNSLVSMLACFGMVGQMKMFLFDLNPNYKIILKYIVCET